MKRMSWENYWQPSVLLMIMLTALCACSYTDSSASWVRNTLDDKDEDGWVDCAVKLNVDSACDCDDDNPAINPAKPDNTCDGVDDDCTDGVDQDATFVTWYLDEDGDGRALDTASPSKSCSGPPTDGQRYTKQLGDCDDSNAARSPALEERCDGIDNDCNELVDDALTQLTVFEDRDKDGYGNPDVNVQDCVEQLPDGYVFLDGDCNDDDAFINPSAAETCNGIDDDCNDLSDLEDGLLSYRVYPDTDQDGYLDRSAPDMTCHAEDYDAQQSASPLSDCDDSRADIHPDIPDTNECNSGIDLNCDGAIASEDFDGDGFTTCTILLDCQPYNPIIYPGVPEACDGKDNDCNNSVDDLDTELALYLDYDRDGYGDANKPPLVLNGCQTVNEGEAYVLSTGDCADDDITRHPQAVELCNGIDDDCDDNLDDGLPLLPWYPDADGDGFGQIDETLTLMACDQPPKNEENEEYAEYSGDCNDEDPTIHPYAKEDCTATVDLNCDGQTSADTDRDGDHQSPCEGDCNDADINVYTGATEACNGIDDNCDLYIDNKGTDLWYQDWDKDGYAPSNSQTPLIGCNNPGWTLKPISYNDCDDRDSERFPGNAEVCDGQDNDCDNTADEDMTCLLPSAQGVLP